MSGVALGIGRGSKMVSNSADWLLRDEFITDLATGSVNGTAAEPGPGTRTVVDTNGVITIADGRLKIVGMPATNNGLTYGVFPRAAGRVFVLSAPVRTTVHSNIRFGLADSMVGDSGISIGFDYFSATTLRIKSGVGVIDAAIVLGGTVQKYASVMRAAGGVLLAKADDGAWNLYWVYHTGTANQYAKVYIAATATNVEFEYFRIPDRLWLPTPLISDGFGSAFGTSDGLGHAEGIAGGIGAGGSGGTWGNVGNTWSVSGGKAINTTPSGLSQQVSVAQVSTADVFASAALTRAAGSVGLALSMDSASSPANGVLVYLDGTNCKVDKIVGGTTSNVRTTAVTYSAGARLVVAKNGSECRVYYNNALVGAANTISDAGIINNTLHGLFSTDASNTLDDFTCYATGSGGEYAELDKWS